MYTFFIKIVETIGSPFVDDEIYYKDGVEKCIPIRIKIPKKN